MIGVTTTWETVLKGHSIRKIENHCIKVFWGNVFYSGTGEQRLVNYVFLN